MVFAKILVVLVINVIVLKSGQDTDVQQGKQLQQQRSKQSTPLLLQRRTLPTWGDDTSGTPAIQTDHTHIHRNTHTLTHQNTWR